MRLDITLSAEENDDNRSEELTQAFMRAFKNMLNQLKEFEEADVDCFIYTPSEDGGIVCMSAPHNRDKRNIN